MWSDFVLHKLQLQNNASITNGNRAFVDNQSTFVVGEGSNLHVGRVENTGAVIGKEGNSTFRIDSYVGKDIQNYDTMTATVRHETQHSNDKSTRLNEGKMKILKKNSITETFEKNGMIYSSDNYWVDERNELVIFFGIRKEEFNTVTVESQLQKRMNRPVRALYNEESLLKENQMTVPYKKNMDMNKSFQELMNKNAGK